MHLILMGTTDEATLRTRIPFPKCPFGAYSSLIALSNGETHLLAGKVRNPDGIDDTGREIAFYAGLNESLSLIPHGSDVEIGVIMPGADRVIRAMSRGETTAEHPDIEAIQKEISLKLLQMAHVKFTSPFLDDSLGKIVRHFRKLDADALDVDMDESLNVRTWSKQMASLKDLLASPISLDDLEPTPEPVAPRM